MCGISLVKNENIKNPQCECAHDKSKEVTNVKVNDDISNT